MKRRNWNPRPGATITDVAVHHLLLSYLYLDEGDLDGYASLLADGARVRRPDLPRTEGREAVMRQMAKIADPLSHHRLYRVIASGDCVAAEGRCTGPPAVRLANGYRDVDFADIVTVSANGLLLYQRRYHDTSKV